MSVGGVVAGLAVGAAILGALYVTGRAPAHPATSPPEPALKPRGGGYYVLLYNYPLRHRDRRLKAFNGPFSSRAEAKKNADSEKDTWYPQIRMLPNDPYTLGLEPTANPVHLDQPMSRVEYANLIAKKRVGSNPISQNAEIAVFGIGAAALVGALAYVVTRKPTATT